jgi:hypothetical protein
MLTHFFQKFGALVTFLDGAKHQNVPKLFVPILQLRFAQKLVENGGKYEN